MRTTLHQPTNPLSRDGVFLTGREIRWMFCSTLLALTMLLTNPMQAQQHSKGAKHPAPKPDPKVGKGRALFTQSCAPCHGANAQGGEGPNLQHIRLTDAQMVATMKTGVKGEMPAFEKK